MEQWRSGAVEGCRGSSASGPSDELQAVGSIVLQACTR